MHSPHLEANIIGISGVILLLTAYFLLQINRITATHLSYSLLNCLGSLFILISLFFCWNLPSAVIEIIWLMVSVFGLIKAIISRGKHKPQMV